MRMQHTRGDISLKKVCKQCGKEFELTQGEIQFYENKNLNIPSRCKECRDKNKQSQQGEQDIEKQAVPAKSNTQSENSRDNNFLRTVVLAFIVVAIAVNSFFANHAGKDSTSTNVDSSDVITTDFRFRNEKLLNEHYQKHGIEMGFSSASEYEAAARKVVEDSKSLHKTEAEDGDDVYYLESSNELVIVSTDGYIRTYFKPNDGIAYYNRQ